MAAMDFPPNPTQGQVYSNGTVSYTYNGYAWVGGSPGSSLYAPLLSPVFTGDPRAPTPPVGDNDTSIATTEFVTANAVKKGGDTMTGDLTTSNVTALQGMTVGNPGVTNPGYNNVAVGTVFTIGGSASCMSASSGTWPLALNQNQPTGGWLMTCGAGGVQVGTISTSSTGTQYTTISDGRLKEDLKSFDAGYIIDAIEVYDFLWKDTAERAYGVIAQQAVEVYPQAITHIENEEDWWGVDYSKYVPVILQELKAVRARLAELEGEKTPIASFNDRLEVLEQALARAQRR